MTTEQNLEITVASRKPGKGNSRTLRTNKQIPAVVYGPAIDNVSFCLSEADAVRYSKHGFENAIFTLKSDDKTLNGLRVLRKETTIHPVSRRPVHMDFFAADMTKKVRVDVEIRFDGKAKGTVDGGIVTTVLRNIEVECLPTEIPEYITVDISDLGLDESLHVSDVQAPEGVKILTSEKETIATCAEPEAEPEATPAAAATDAAATPAPEKA